ncbi:MAG: FG-GAP-like repeat-containing protein [Bacteroidota bacterium]
MNIRLKAAGLLLLISNFTLAQDFSGLNELTEGLASPQDIKISDLNNDGHLDLITASRDDKKVAWYPNLGNAVFGRQIVITRNANGARSLDVGDLNNDGHIDIVSASLLDNRIAWYKNSDQGSDFEQISLSTSGDGAWEVDLFDYDSDGDLDIFAIYFNANEVVLFENLGTGDFSSEILISNEVEEPRAISCLDVDGDGLKDILIGSGTFFGDYLSYCKNEGNSSFSGPEFLSTQVSRISDLELADLDNDGDLDIIAAQGDGASIIEWIENEGANSFDNVHSISTTSSDVSDVDIADLNGDGNLDIVAGHDDFSKTIEVFLNDGFGEFAEGQSISPEHTKRSAVAIEDIDGDNDIDVLSTFNLFDELILTRNNGLAEFSSGEKINTSLINPIEPQLGDMDMDGDLDLVFSAYQGDLFVLDNIGGSFDQQSQLLDNEDFGLFETLDDFSVGDLDGDLDPDITLATNQGFYWGPNQGDGSVNELNLIEGLGPLFNKTHIADLNADGHHDVFAADASFDDLFWFINDGIGNFGNERVVVEDLHDFSDIETSDINGDGYLDVLSVGYGGAIELKLYDVLDLDFEPIIFPSTAWMDISDIAAVDIDQDGDKDIVYSERTNNLLVWIESDGTGYGFIEHVIDSLLPDPKSFGTGDLNEDGFPDIVLADFSTGDISYYKNLSGFGFDEPVILNSEIDNPMDIDVLDIDGDTDLDILFCSGKDQGIYSLNNLNVVISSSQEIAKEKFSFAFPNPCFDLLLLELDQNKEIDQIFIYNSIGKIVSNHQFKDRKEKYQLDISHLKSGTYYIQALSGDRTYSQSVIKL